MKSEPNTMKRRLLLVQKLLYETTDEQHPLNTFEILDYLQEQGIVTNRKTLKGDIDLMVECGMDIITVQSKPNRYFWGARNFEQAELKLLIDAVSSSRFITLKKSKDLCRKIMALSSTSGKKELKRNIYATNRIKSKNESLLYIVDTVNEAIIRKKQITFQYTEYAPDKKKILRNDGEIYTLSPYALFWNEDFYYVVGHSEKHDNISSFRADRICHIELSEEDAAKKPAGFVLDRYSRQIFEMYANTIYFGSGYYGIAEAAEGYFGKEPAQLTDAEAIYLAGMPNAPSTYASSPELAFKRMQVVLKRMVKCRVLTQQQADAIAADAENLTV